MKKGFIAAGLTTLALVLSGCNFNKSNKAKYTIMVYMCGADLESDSGLASMDIYEMCTVMNQPKDVNIILQTGGSTRWNNGRIEPNKLQRFHVEKRGLVEDDIMTAKSMGESKTFQSFLEWGLTEYPAEKTGVIMWNHGGAMQGVCFDERFGNDGLLSSEVTKALKGAFENTGRKEKLEWIGYDACLMAVQDLAEANSDYFNYMVAAQESEAGEGWDYDHWVDNLYAHDDTETILKEICDTFLDSYHGRPNDQTLSVLDLSKMSAYKSAWDELSEEVNLTVSSSQKNDFQNMMKSVKTFGTTYYSEAEIHEMGFSTNPNSNSYFGKVGIIYENGSYILPGYNNFGTFDVMDFLNKLDTNYSSMNSQINSVKSAYNDLVIYNKIGKDAGESNGLCLFFPMHKNCHADTYYSASQTRFSSWRNVVASLGELK